MFLVDVNGHRFFFSQKNSQRCIFIVRIWSTFQGSTPEILIVLASCFRKSKIYCICWAYFSQDETFLWTYLWKHCNSSDSSMVELMAAFIWKSIQGGFYVGMYEFSLHSNLCAQTRARSEVCDNICLPVTYVSGFRNTANTVISNVLEPLTPSWHATAIRCAGAWSAANTLLIMTCMSSAFWLDSCHFNQLTQNCCMFGFILVNFLLLSIWQPNFTRAPLAWEDADSIIRTGQCFHTPLAKGLGHGPTSTAQCAGCWKRHLISSLRWQEALIYGTQESFFFPSPTSGPFQMHGQMNTRRPDCQENR